MKKSMSIYAVAAIAVMAFSADAFARGGNQGNGKGYGRASAGTNQTTATKPQCDGTGIRQQSATGTRPMDGTGNRYGQARAGATTPATAQTPAATTTN